MIAIQYDKDSQAVYILWGCAAPQNNVWEFGEKRFSGVGGHLFAIATDLSVKAGFDGFVVAEAMDQELFDYYITQFGALPLPPINNPYRFMISDEMAKKLREVYIYEWTDEEI